MYSQNFYFLLLGRFIFGLGSESISVAAATIEANWFYERKLSLVMGLEYSIANIGVFICDTLEPFLYDYTNSLTKVFLVGLLICLISLLGSSGVYFLEQKRIAEPNFSNQNHSNPPLEITEIFGLPIKYWTIILLIILGTSPMLLFNNVASEFYQLKLNFSTQSAGAVIGIQSLTLAIFLPIFGYFIDKFSENRKLLGIFI